MKLKCLFPGCGWSGTEKEGAHFTTEELSVLKYIKYRDAILFGIWCGIKNYNIFIADGAHICPKCSSKAVNIEQLTGHINDHIAESKNQKKMTDPIILKFKSKLESDLIEAKKENLTALINVLVHLLAYFNNENSLDIMDTPEGVHYTFKFSIQHAICKQTVYLDNDMDTEFNTVLEEVIILQNYQKEFEELGS